MHCIHASDIFSRSLNVMLLEGFLPCEVYLVNVHFNSDQTTSFIPQNGFYWADGIVFAR